MKIQLARPTDPLSGSRVEGRLSKKNDAFYIDYCRVRGAHDLNSRFNQIYRNRDTEVCENIKSKWRTWKNQKGYFEMMESQQTSMSVAHSKEKSHQEGSNLEFMAKGFDLHKPKPNIEPSFADSSNREIKVPQTASKSRNLATIYNPRVVKNSQTALEIASLPKNEDSLLWLRAK